MIFIRSLLFNFIFWLVSIFFIIGLLPAILFHRLIIFAPLVWARVGLYLLKICTNIDFCVEGKENLPKGGFIIASKHQSAWETMAFNFIFPKTSFVLKKELTSIFPLNFYIKHTGMVPLDRQGGVKALQSLIQHAKVILDQRRSLVIFPEGTRTPVGQKSSYKRGIYTLYKHLECPVVPVALNSGVCWKRRGFKKFPGTIVVKVLPPIQPGLSSEIFMETLENMIETASQKLLMSI